MAKQPERTPLAAKLRRDVFFGTAPDLPRIIEVDLLKLRSNPDQPRRTFDPVTIQELAASIRQHGLIQPIAITRDPVHADGFLIVAGERRYRAFQHLGRETIPAILTQGAPDEIALIENIQRENLHPLDEAHAFTHLMHKHGYTQEELSQVVGKARSTVTEMLRLTSLPQHIQEECRTSDIPKSTLIELTRLRTSDEQLALWEHMKGGSVTVRALRARKKRSSSPQVAQSLPEQTLRVGHTFAQYLQHMASERVAVESSWKQALATLRDDITALIAQLEDTEQKE